MHPREDADFITYHPRTDQQAVLALGLYLEARAEAAVYLELSHVNLKEKFIFLDSFFAKNGDPHWLPIPEHLFGYIDAQYRAAQSRGSEWLFPMYSKGGRQSKDGHMHAGRPRKLAVEAGVSLGYNEKDIYFHRLRTIAKNRIEAASLWKKIEDSKAASRDLLNHKTEESAKPYEAMPAAYMRDLIEAYDEWLTVQESDTSVVRLRTNFS